VQYRPVVAEGLLVAAEGLLVAAEGLVVASLPLFRPMALLDVRRVKGFTPPGNGRGTFRR
jgi:hypothetical protein